MFQIKYLNCGLNKQKFTIVYNKNEIFTLQMWSTTMCLCCFVISANKLAEIVEIAQKWQM